MLFYVNDAISKSPIYILGKGQRTTATYRQLLEDDGKLIEAVSKSFNCDVLYEVANDHVILTLEADQPSGIVNMVIAVRMAQQLKVRELNEDYRNQLAVHYKQKYNVDLADEDIVEFLKAYWDFVDYIGKPMEFTVNLPKYMAKSVADRTKLSELNTKIQETLVPGLSFVKQGKNRTHKMRKSTDYVFIELPSYERIESETLYDFPLRDNVLPKLSDNMFATRMYKTVASELDMPFIEGDASNNRLEIQDNEKDFYNALNEYIDYCIEQEYNKKPIELNNEEFMESDVIKYLTHLAVHVASFNWSHTGMLPQLVKEKDPDADKDDDTVEAEVVMSKYYLSQDGSSRHVRGDSILETFITSCVSSSDYMYLRYGETCKIEHPYAISEIIIKLLRFGSRKPNKLYIPTFNRDLDLNTFEINGRVECFDDGIPYRPNGREFIYESPIIMSGKIADTNYLSSIGVRMPSFVQPVGAVCVRESLLDKCPDGVKGKYEYEGKYYNSKCRQRVYLSLIDIYEILADSPQRIGGISIEDGDIKVTGGSEDNEILIEQANRKCMDSKDVENVFVTSSNITYLALNTHASNKNVSYLNIINNFSKMENAGLEIASLTYDSAQECAEKVRKTGKSQNELLVAKIADATLPQLYKSMAICEEKRANSESGVTTLEEALNTLAKVICKEPIDLTLEDGKSQKTAKLGLNTSKVLDKINKQNTETKASPSGGLTMKDLIAEVPQDARLHPIVRNMRHPHTKSVVYSIVGYYTIIDTPSGKKRLFTSPLETSGVKVLVGAPDQYFDRNEIKNTDAIKLNTVLFSLSKDFFYSLNGQIDKVTSRFSSEAVYISLLKEAQR